MLIKFIIKNFKSFKEQTILSMVASSLTDFEENNVITTPKLRVLKIGSIYGANASGKSNLIDGLATMRWLIINSAKNVNRNEQINVEPFLLHTGTENEPSEFEIELMLNTTRYRYGFLVDKKKVHEEWLFETKKRKEYPMFLRKEQTIKVWDRFKSAKGLEKRTRPNALFLSVAGHWEAEEAIEINNWFWKMNLIHGLKTEEYTRVTIEKIKKTKDKRKIMKLLRYADLGIDDVKIYEGGHFYDSVVAEERLMMYGDIYKSLGLEKPDETEIKTTHAKYNEQGNRLYEAVQFSMKDQESEGTKKYFNIIGKIVEAIEKNEVVVIDELDARLHPLITKSIIRLFTSIPESRAQIIFTTHDTNILDKRMIRRDEVYFVEKDKFGASKLYSLVEFKTRKESPMDKNYLNGKFGAIPFVKDFSTALRERHIEEDFTFREMNDYLGEY